MQKEQKVMNRLGTGALVVGAGVFAYGVLAYYGRYDLITGEQYDVSMIPIYIIGAGILLLLVGLGLRVVRPSSKP